MLLGYGAKVGLGNMRVKAENRMVTLCIAFSIIFVTFVSLFTSFLFKVESVGDGKAFD